MSFESFYSIKQYKKVVENVHEKLLGHITDRQMHENLKALAISDFSSSLENYLISLRDEGKLNSVDGFEIMKLRFLSSWNRFVNKNNTADDWSLISSFISNHFIFQNGRLLENNGSKITYDVINRSYLALVESVNKGDVCINRRDCCAITGNDVCFDMDGWCLSCLSFDKTYNLVPLVLPDSPSIRINKITLETGHLLAADWFGIDEFTKLVCDNDKPSIVFSDGRDKEQARLAEKFNFLSIHVGNSNPAIMEKDGIFLAAHINDERDVDEQHTIVGTIHTAQWTVTLIEKENLIRLVALTTGHHRAVEIVDDYISKNEYDIAEINVDPGTYYCYSSGRYDRFGEYLTEYVTPFEGLESPLFVFSNKELELALSADLSHA